MKREKNYDALRVISVILIVLIHSCTLEFNYIQQGLLCLASLAVPAFIMLSGAFTLSNSENEAFGSFYRKSRKKILYPYLFWALICITMTYFWNIYGVIIRGDALQLWYLPFIDILQKGYPGLGYHLWFMYIIIGLYVCVPVIIRIKKSISCKSYVGLGILCMTIGMIQSRTCQMYWPFIFQSYLGYFILGDILRSRAKTKNKRECILSFCFMTILLIILYLCKVYAVRGNNICRELVMDHTSEMNNIQPFSLLVILATIAAFNFVAHLNVSLNLSWFAKNAFHVYLMHVIIIPFVALNNYGIHMPLNKTATVLYRTIATVAVCYTLIFIWQKLIHRRIIRKSDE